MRTTTQALGAIGCVVLLAVSALGAAGAVATATQAANEPLPPGVGDEGVTNSTALVEAHVTAVNETGATLAVGSEYSVNDSYYVSQSTTSTFGEGVSPFRLRTVGTFEDENETVRFLSDQWANETVLVSKVSYENRTEYTKQYLNATAGPADPFSDDLPRRYVEEQVTGEALLAGTLSLGNFTVESTETVGGENLTTLTAAGVNESVFNGTAAVERFDATIVVNEEGRVRALNATVSYEQNGSTFDYSYDLELLATGDAEPLEPLWSDRAVAQPAVSVDMNASDSYFTLTNYGPDALPANSTVVATHDNRTVNLTLSEDLGANESVYVYYSSDGGPAQLAATPPAPENATALSGEYDFEIRSPDGTTIIYIGFGFASANETTTNAVGAEAPAAVGTDSPAAVGTTPLSGLVRALPVG
ncbi:hypothetical protein ACFQMA_00800 [Halosimplex aquaticum]|uniref:Uncharacterized protein n=1 Tax=Halosimplex aquaticum TaxID=3026162 RepID=A0ABD5XXY3_9EURY|nr:hypothetical protein [Halosimplex aquaticum]